MPTVEIFDGIKIEMYVNDRNPPHVHIKYAEHKCILEIQTGNIYAGNLPLRQMKKSHKLCCKSSGVIAYVMEST